MLALMKLICTEIFRKWTLMGFMEKLKNIILFKLEISFPLNIFLIITENLVNTLIVEKYLAERLFLF